MIDVYKFLKNYTKVELIYFNSANKKFTFYCDIKEILDDKLILNYPRGKEKFNIVAEYAKLTAVFCTEDGVLSGNVNLIKNNVLSQTVTISFPYNNQFCQRRENTRIPMHVDVEITIGKNVFNLKTKNISGKGIACLTDEPLPDFTDEKVVIHMPSKEITAIAKKVYSRQIDLDETQAFLNGIMLTEIAEEDVNTIIKDCLKFQLESKHNERLFETL